jgi:SEC-C motif-containing protein
VASRALKYMRLTILDAKDAEVLFLAAVFEKGKDRSFVELSSFARDGGSWRYLSGQSREASAIRDVTRLTIATVASAAAESP